MPPAPKYLDSSVALHAILKTPQQNLVRRWIDAQARLVSSRLLRTEIIRVLRRENLPLDQATPLLDRVGLLDITRGTHAVAESIERHVKTLDALHLATALSLGTTTTIITHDQGMVDAATILGFTVEDPLE